MRTLLVLDDDACPAELQACYPRGGSRFSIQMRRGGLVRVHDSVLMPNVILIKHICVRMTRVSITLFSYVQSQYKSLLISERTTIDDLIELLLRCHSNNERIERFSIYEVNIHFRNCVQIDLFLILIFFKNSFLTFFCCCRFVISLATSTNGNYIPTIWR